MLMNLTDLKKYLEAILLKVDHKASQSTQTTQNVSQQMRATFYPKTI
jgi:ribosomal protein L15E